MVQFINRSIKSLLLARSAMSSPINPLSSFLGCCMNMGSDSDAVIDSSCLSSLKNQDPSCVLVAPGKCQFTPEFINVKLLERAKVTHNTSVLRFACPDETQPLNLSTCACLLAKTTLPVSNTDDGETHDDKKTKEDVIRPYTPISTNAMTGKFDLLVKHYEGGKMTQYMKNMKVGDEIAFKHIDFNVKIQAPFAKKNIGMIVGGTGVTPMIQALHAILAGEKDTKVTVLYGNRSEEDILGRELLDAWQSKFSDQLEVIHVLSHEPEDSTWQGERGFISKELIEKKFAKPGDDVLVFVCGPPAMYTVFSGDRGSKELSGILHDIGYDAAEVYKF